MGGMNASQLQYDVFMGNADEKFWFQDEAYPCADCCENNIVKGCDDDIFASGHRDQSMKILRPIGSSEGTGDQAGNAHHLLAFVAITISFFSFMTGLCVRKM